MNSLKNHLCSMQIKIKVNKINITFSKWSSFAQTTYLCWPRSRYPGLSNSPRSKDWTTSKTWFERFHMQELSARKCWISNFVQFPGLYSNPETLLLDVNNIVSSAVQSAGCTLIKIFGINQIFVKFKIQIVNMSHIYESRWTWEFDFDAVRWCFIDRCMYTVQTQVQRSF